MLILQNHHSKNVNKKESQHLLFNNLVKCFNYHWTRQKKSKKCTQNNKNNYNKFLDIFV
jgi:hypothetical protein